MSVFNYQKDSDGIVTITMDMTGPVNAMNADYNGAMEPTLERLEDESGLKELFLPRLKVPFLPVEI